MHSPWVGVDLATDQVRWARLLRCAHEVTLSGRGSPAVLREVIVRSWARCLEAGVDPERPAPRFLDSHEAEQRLHGHPLATVVPLVGELFAEVAPEARHLAVLADADGLLLWTEGHRSMMEAAGKPHFLRGCLFSERVVGTNAIGTTLALDHAVQVFSAAHFNRLLHGWATSAAPIHEPGTNQQRLELPDGISEVSLDGGLRLAIEPLAPTRASFGTQVPNPARRGRAWN